MILMKSDISNVAREIAQYVTISETMRRVFQISHEGKGHKVGMSQKWKGLAPSYRHGVILEVR